MDFLMLYQRSFLAGLLTAVATALMGVHVVFRRMAFFGDAIAHVAFAAAAIGVTIGVSSFLSAVVLAVVASLILAKLSRRNISEDVSVGVLFSLTMAIGVILFSLVKRQRNLMSYLFGDILTVTDTDMFYLSIVTVSVIVYNLLFKDTLVQFTFDEDFTKLMRPKIDLIYQLFLAVLAITVVIGVRTVGVILVSAFLIIPAATASIGAKDYRKVFLFAPVLSSISVVVGLLLSLYMDVPPGALIVVVQGAMFFTTIALRR
ncbi:metal ABC transporter permease [Pseudothermotoga sp.]|nr:metal ABC transporter permease [Pseudothermotoga sp.]MCX7813076.1 metal ABC transporter permease [Pseudothermotoga sp.]MDW8140478.1 metal ABC transporter permease [Pseudothermotoga sp.]